MYVIYRLSKELCTPQSSSGDGKCPGGSVCDGTEGPCKVHRRIPCISGDYFERNAASYTGLGNASLQHLTPLA